MAKTLHSILSHKLMIGTKTFPFKSLRQAIVVFGLGLVLAACKEPTASDVVGVYRRTTSTVNEVIQINKDQTYTQLLTYSDGKTFSTKGVWSLRHRAVNFGSFYESFDIESQKDVNPPKFGNSITISWKEGYLVVSEVGPYVLHKE
jgi:hypothetical protein